MTAENPFNDLYDEHQARTGEDLRNMSPEEVSSLPPLEGLKPGPERITGPTLIDGSPEARQRRFLLSEEFLKRPRIDFPEED